MQISVAERMNPNDGGEPTMAVHMLVVLSQMSQNLLVSQLQFDCVIYCVMVSSLVYFSMFTSVALVLNVEFIWVFVTSYV